MVMDAFLGWAHRIDLHRPQDVERKRAQWSTKATPRTQIIS